MALSNGLKLGQQPRGRSASRLQAKEAIDRTLKIVRRFWASLRQTHAQVKERTHGTLEWPKTWPADSGQTCESFASKKRDRSYP